MQTDSTNRTFQVEYLGVIKKGKAEKVSGDEERGPQRQQIRT